MAIRPKPSDCPGEERPRAEEWPQWEDYVKCIHCLLCGGRVLTRLKSTVEKFLGFSP